MPYFGTKVYLEKTDEVIHRSCFRVRAGVEGTLRSYLVGVYFFTSPYSRPWLWVVGCGYEIPGALPGFQCGTLQTNHIIT